MNTCADLHKAHAIVGAVRHSADVTAGFHHFGHAKLLQRALAEQTKSNVRKKAMP